MSTDQEERMTSSQNALLTRGELALRALQLRKRAAEFEAVAAELEAAVLLARSGDPAQLERWMQQHSSMHGDLLEERLGDAPSLAKAFVGSPPPEMAAMQQGSRMAQDSESAVVPRLSNDSSAAGNAGGNAAENGQALEDAGPWNAMLTAVRTRRGASRNSEQKAVEGMDWTDSTAAARNPAVSKSRGSTKDLPTLQASASQGEEKQSSAARTRKPFASPKPSTVKIPRSVLQAVSEQKKEKKSKVQLAWLGSSWGSSLLVHFLIGGIFLFVTVKLADEKVLSIVSAPVETTEALLETPMEFDAELPEELSETVPVEAESTISELATVDVSSSLPESTLGDLMAGDQAQSTQSSLAQAIALGGAASRVANVQFFGVQAEGNNFCYIVDNSGSMKRDGAFEAAKSELVRSLASMKPSQRFYIYFFSDQVDALSLDGRNAEKYPVYATPENLEKAAVWIQSIPIRGGRPPNDALSMAIEMQPDAIFLLFDGDTKVDVPAHLRKVNRVSDIIAGEQVRVPIHTIGFYTQEFEPMMKKIAEENHGTYRFVPNPRKRTN